MAWVVDCCIIDIAGIPAPTSRYPLHIPASRIALSHFQLLYARQDDLICCGFSVGLSLSYWWESLVVCGLLRKRMVEISDTKSPLWMKIQCSLGAELTDNGFPSSSALIKLLISKLGLSHIISLVCIQLSNNVLWYLSKTLHYQGSCISAEEAS